MTEKNAARNLDDKELDATQAEEIGGGLDGCSADEWRQLTASFKESYDNLVDFTSYVIERVAGGSGS